MPSPTKVPYYRLEYPAGFFGSKEWKEYKNSQGCIPINTQKTVSMDRLLPNEVPPPPPPPPPPEPKLAAAQAVAQKQDEERLRRVAANIAKHQGKGIEGGISNPSEPLGEDCEKPPVFDMLDIPDAMERIGWPVSAKLARRWFNAPKHIYNNKPNSVQPVDDATVTLEWVLSFGGARAQFDELLAENVYSEKALLMARTIVREKMHDTFVVRKTASSLSFDTHAHTGDLRQFHNDWQFQLKKVNTAHTANGFGPTDLTGALGNFGIYAAIGNVTVNGEKYYRYDNRAKTKTYCLDAKVQITHIYVYIADNYSFNDEPNAMKSQYLGHWNKTGFIVTSGGFIAELNDPHFMDRWDYLSPINALDRPVDVRSRIFGKFKERDVYFPIYNKSYNEWRDRHNHGGDFMIYSKPKYLKLKRPIEFALETVCRNPEPM